MQVHGMALVAGIGFMMSIVIGSLAFADPALTEKITIGLLAGSIASAVTGVAVLARCGRST